MFHHTSVQCDNRSKRTLLTLKCTLYTAVLVFNPFRMIIQTKNHWNEWHNSKQPILLLVISYRYLRKPAHNCTFLVSPEFNFKWLQIRTNYTWTGPTFKSSGGRGGAGGFSFGGGGGGFPLVWSNAGTRGTEAICSKGGFGGPLPSLWLSFAFSCFNFWRFSRCFLYQRCCCSYNKQLRWIRTCTRHL